MTGDRWQVKSDRWHATGDKQQLKGHLKKEIFSFLAERFSVSCVWDFFKMHHFNKSYQKKQIGQFPKTKKSIYSSQPVHNGEVSRGGGIAVAVSVALWLWLWLWVLINKIKCYYPHMSRDSVISCLLKSCVCVLLTQ